MKELARVVHDLATGNETPGRSDLSELEQMALADMEPLLRLSPRDLSELLAHNQDMPDWLPTSSSSQV